MPKYIRDKRSPKPSNRYVSKLMSSIKYRDTKPELIFRKLLWNNGLKGYRLHWKVEGRPDIAFPGRKLAIFIHGCYWHRCPKCKLPTPKTNTEFWLNKFMKNVERDKRKIRNLENYGWKVLVFWECEVKSKPDHLIRQVEKNIDNK